MSSRRAVAVEPALAVEIALPLVGSGEVGDSLGQLCEKFGTIGCGGHFVALLVGADAMHPKSRSEAERNSPKGRSPAVQFRACSSKDEFWQGAVSAEARHGRDIDSPRRSGIPRIWERATHHPTEEARRACCSTAPGLRSLSSNGATRHAVCLEEDGHDQGEDNWIPCPGLRRREIEELRGG